MVKSINNNLKIAGARARATKIDDTHFTNTTTYLRKIL